MHDLFLMFKFLHKCTKLNKLYNTTFTSLQSLSQCEKSTRLFIPLSAHCSVVCSCMLLRIRFLGTSSQYQTRHTARQLNVAKFGSTKLSPSAMHDSVAPPDVGPMGPDATFSLCHRPTSQCQVEDDDCLSGFHRFSLDTGTHDAESNCRARCAGNRGNGGD